MCPPSCVRAWYSQYLSRSHRSRLRTVSDTDDDEEEGEGERGVDAGEYEGINGAGGADEQSPLWQAGVGSESMAEGAALRLAREKREKKEARERERGVLKANNVDRVKLQQQQQEEDDGDGSAGGGEENQQRSIFSICLRERRAQQKRSTPQKTISEVDPSYSPPVAAAAAKLQPIPASGSAMVAGLAILEQKQQEQQLLKEQYESKQSMLRECYDREREQVAQKQQ